MQVIAVKIKTGGWVSTMMLPVDRFHARSRNHFSRSNWSSEDPFYLLVEVGYTQIDWVVEIIGARKEVSQSGVH